MEENKLWEMVLGVILFCIFFSFLLRMNEIASEYLEMITALYFRKRW